MSIAAEQIRISSEQLETLTLHAKYQKASGDKICVNLPMTLVKLCVEKGIALPSLGKSGKVLQQIDLKQILERVEQGNTGHLAQLKSAGGDVLELVVE